MKPNFFSDYNGIIFFGEAFGGISLEYFIFSLEVKLPNI